MEDQQNDPESGHDSFCGMAFKEWFASATIRTDNIS